MVLWNQQTQWINTLFFFKVGKVVGHLPLGKSEKLAKTIYFYKAGRNLSCRINVLGKSVSDGDELRIKVPHRKPLFQKINI